MVWFETILVVLTLLTGLIWLVDKLFFAKAPQADAPACWTRRSRCSSTTRARSSRCWRSCWCLRSFVAEPFRIPSSSMMPTLLIGDFILVNKFAYGLRLPVNNKKFVAIGEPKRGDVVVFRPGRTDPDQDWIKRVIGLPGDKIAYRDNTVFVNGVALKYQQIGVYVGKGQGADMTGADLRQEDLPDRPHPVLEREDSPFSIQGKGNGWCRPATISSWATIVIIARTAVSGPCTSCRRRTSAARRS